MTESLGSIVLLQELQLADARMFMAQAKVQIHPALSFQVINAGLIKVFNMDNAVKVSYLHSFYNYDHLCSIKDVDIPNIPISYEH